MFADWLESIRIEGGEPALDTLYGSAEAFLQTWARAQAAATATGG